jgi:hypothetical protein
MISLKTILSVFIILACFVAIAVAKKDEEDSTAQAIKDLKVGMDGLEEASSNPAVLAQLMKDLQVSEVLNLKVYYVINFFTLLSCFFSAGSRTNG